MARLKAKVLFLFISVLISGCSHGMKNVSNVAPITVASTSSDIQQPEQPIESSPERHFFIVSPGDEISVTVYRQEDLNRRILIPPDSYIFFPLVGELNISDMSTNQIRRTLTEGLSKYIIDPQVSVDVISIRSQKLFVLGEVNRPGVFEINGEMDIIEAISRAGGFTRDAKKDKVLLIRGNLLSPQIKTFDIDKALKNGDITQNIILQKKDIVYVPPSYIASMDRFFKHFENVVRPIVLLEQGIVLSPQVEDVLKGDSNKSDLPPLVITPP